MNSYELNKAAWDHAVEVNNPYTKTVSPQQIAEARQGKWSLYLSACKPMPQDWFPRLNGIRVLCLAAGGGQQAPVLAALGADVTVFDASPRQLTQDRFVAERDRLAMKFVEGDMADLSAFANASFELIINPVSTLFAPDVAPIWRECYRVLQTGGALITCFINPDEFVFDDASLDNEGVFEVRRPLPYVEYKTLDNETLEERIRNKEMFHFSHTMEAQIGGLTQAGFAITDFYEDRRSEEDGNPIRNFMPSYFIVRAEKLELRPRR